MLTRAESEVSGYHAYSVRFRRLEAIRSNSLCSTHICPDVEVSCMKGAGSAHIDPSTARRSQPHSLQIASNCFLLLMARLCDCTPLKRG